MRGLDQLETFLTQLEIELISIGWDTKIEERKERYQKLRRLLQSL